MIALVSPRAAALAALSLMALGCADDAAPAATDAASDAVAMDAALDAPRALDVPRVTVEAGALAQPLVEGLAITSVAFFQSVKVPVVTEAGPIAAEERVAPVVAGRRAAVRVYVAPRPGWTPRTVTAQLFLEGAGQRWALEDTRFITGASTEGSASSVFSFDVAAERVVPGLRVSAQLSVADGRAMAAGGSSEARMPPDGTNVPVGVEANPGPLRVMLVPYRYNTDMSGRLPDTSEAQLERFRSLLLAMFPISAVELTLHDPLPWTRPLLQSGNVDFVAMTGELRNLRRVEAAEDAVYYYGLIQPTERFDQYCRGGCTLGQGFVVLDFEDGARRVAGGVGFTGDRASSTLAHELGHLHGRLHSPCGATGVDPAYPYPNGALGTWGWDARRRFFYPPGMFDFMSYCDPDWISDYSYGALYQRAMRVGGVAAQRWRAPGAEAVAPAAPRHLVRWGGGEAAGWVDVPLVTDAQLVGPRRTLRWRDAAGRDLGGGEAVVEALAEGGAQAVLPVAPEGARVAALGPFPGGDGFEADGARVLTLPTR